jgi:hypothetical protein
MMQVHPVSTEASKHSNIRVGSNLAPWQGFEPMSARLRSTPSKPQRDQSFLQR